MYASTFTEHVRDIVFTTCLKRSIVIRWHKFQTMLLRLNNTFTDPAWPLHRNYEQWSNRNRFYFSCNSSAYKDNFLSFNQRLVDSALIYTTGTLFTSGHTSPIFITLKYIVKYFEQLYSARTCYQRSTLFF